MLLIKHPFPPFRARRSCCRVADRTPGHPDSLSSPLPLPALFNVPAGGKPAPERQQKSRRTESQKPEFNRVDNAFRVMGYLAGMGRHRKPLDTAQRSAIKINATAAEKAELLARAGAHDLPISAYLRQVLFNRTLRSVGDREAGIDLLVIAEKLRQLREESSPSEQQPALAQLQADVEAVARRLVG
ncbi:MAG: plasmid mobilization protein [Steroidobacteraceae bacterium]